LFHGKYNRAVAIGTVPTTLGSRAFQTKPAISR
jgi:hypothetical protein